mmetsp:Transcript_2994/g.7271  ORF Transcript_2994/g.7271 Transcript_2994/m.7271 type:complete len:101 (-) Transcript_2994:7-309(-)
MCTNNKLLKFKPHPGRERPGDAKALPRWNVGEVKAKETTMNYVTTKSMIMKSVGVGRVEGRKRPAGATSQHFLLPSSPSSTKAEAETGAGAARQPAVVHT